MSTKTTTRTNAHPDLEERRKARLHAGRLRLQRIINVTQAITDPDALDHVCRMVALGLHVGQRRNPEPVRFGASVHGLG